MNELVSTRNNPLIDPHLHVWGAPVGLDLFLGGLVAGILVLSGLYYLTHGKDRPAPGFIRNSLLAAPFLLALGVFLLFIDLDNKWHVFRFYTTFQVTSPMSWGSWIILFVFPASAALIVLAHRDHPWLQRYPSIGQFAVQLVERWWRAIAIVNITLGAMLGLYTGVLLSVAPGRPLWNHGMMAPLFLVSGLATGAAWMALFHSGGDDQDQRDLNLILAGLMGAEALALLLVVSTLLTAAGSQKASIFLMVGGPYTAVFWVFVVGIGLVIPLILQILQLFKRLESRFVMPLMVLAGGASLRLIIVSAGQLSEVLR
jgi:formate-dependent nitrite reductase membrane component NrfD